MGMSALAFQTFPDQVKVSGTGVQSQAGVTSRHPTEKKACVFTSAGLGEGGPSSSCPQFGSFPSCKTKIFAHFSSGSGSPCEAGRRIHQLSCGPRGPVIREPQAVSFPVPRQRGIPILFLCGRPVWAPTARVISGKDRRVRQRWQKPQLPPNSPDQILKAKPVQLRSIPFKFAKHQLRGFPRLTSNTAGESWAAGSSRIFILHSGSLSRVSAGPFGHYHPFTLTSFWPRI